MRIASLFVVALLAAPFAAACGDDGAVATSTSGAGGDGGESSGEGGKTGIPSGGTTATTGTPSGTGSTSTSTSTGDGGAGPGTGAGGPGTGAGGPGTGGSGEGGSAEWPACLIENFGGEEHTILDVWEGDSIDGVVYWIPDVVVTAVSLGGCEDGEFCQIFVQQEETFADLDEGAQQAIRVLVAPEAAIHFEGIGVGDRVDLGGEAYRDVEGGRNELRFFVRESAPGCMDIVGSGDPQPVDATLVDLTQEAYEETMGPLLVRLETVSGRPHQPTELFALWDSEEGPDDGGLETVTNMSPFFIPSGMFTGLDAEEIVDFASVTGVYGQFFRDDTMAKYETIYVRSQSDAPIAD